ncbi:MAG: aminotransferase class IV [Gammaproteobacteria bacterium]
MNDRNEFPDPRNAEILVWVGDGLVLREQASVSVFDSVVQGGDAVWEGLRVYNGRIMSFDEHLDRLFASAKAMAFAEVPSRQSIKNAIFATLNANGMRDGAHMRLTLTRGRKTTSNMDPRVNRYGSTLIVLAEWKAPIYPSGGVRLITSSIRRNPPQCLDSKIHHNNLINNILAKIEANNAGVDEAIMLDIHGFVAETNATNLFLIRDGVLVTPAAEHCLPGITRRNVLRLAREAGYQVEERHVTVSEFQTADEVFTTGTVGELCPVLEVDGRVIGHEPGPATRRLQSLYAELVSRTGEPIPEPETENTDV